MNWLTLQPDDPTLPPDIPRRTQADFQRLRHYGERLAGDVIALEEIGSPEAVWRVFDERRYKLYLSSDAVAQRVGFLVRNDISVLRHPDLTVLSTPRPGSTHRLRSGVDITIKPENAPPLRLLAVHLKAGCWARPLDERQHACPTLYRQFHDLEDWILDREDAGDAYIILGDFNRQLTAEDPLMKDLRNDAPLTLATTGLASPCNGGRRFIDHLILGGLARHWVRPGSLRVLTYRDEDETEKTENLSDHCPVSLHLTVPLAPEAAFLDNSRG